MVSGKNLVSGTKSEYTYNGLLARVKKTSRTTVSSYMPDYLDGIRNDFVTQISGVGTVNAVYGQGYGRVSQRFMPAAGTEASDTYFQHDLYGSTLFAADAQGVIKHRAAHDIWGMPKAVCDDTGIASGLRFTTYDYDSVLGKHFAHARMYDPAQGRMRGIDPVKRGLNGYAYCDNDPANQTDPTGEVANVVIGVIAGAVIGGAFGFAGSALSQLAEGKGFNARKAWGAAANGAIVGAARGALIASGAGIPLAFGVDFAAGMAGSLAEQKITGARLRAQSRAEPTISPTCSTINCGMLTTQESGRIREPGIHGTRRTRTRGTAELRDRQEAGARSRTAEDRNRSRGCAIRSGEEAAETAHTMHSQMTGSVLGALSGMSLLVQRWADCQA